MCTISKKTYIPFLTTTLEISSNFGRLDGCSDKESEHNNLDNPQNQNLTFNEEGAVKPNNKKSTYVT